MDKSKTILIVEDEMLSAEYLKVLLEQEEYEVVGIVDKGADAITKAKQYKPDMVLMDIMLGDNISGCEAAVQIRQYDKKCRIIFITAYAEDEMIDYALLSQAHSYLMKPYKDKMVLATIKLAFSSNEIQHQNSEQDIIELKDEYIYNTKLNRLFKQGIEMPLGKKPLKLIEILAKNKNTSVSNEQICYHIWGKMIEASTLRSLIHRIRHILGTDIIKNVNGVGYSII